MVLTRIDPTSCAKVYGLVCVVIGFILGLVFALVSWMASGLMDDGAGLGMMFGAGSIIFFPIIYGVAGFVMGYVSAAVYNAAAKYVGGIQLDFE